MLPRQLIEVDYPIPPPRGNLKIDSGVVYWDHPPYWVMWGSPGPPSGPSWDPLGTLKLKKIDQILKGHAPQIWGRVFAGEKSPCGRTRGR